MRSDGGSIDMEGLCDFGDRGSLEYLQYYFKLSVGELFERIAFFIVDQVIGNDRREMVTYIDLSAKYLLNGIFDLRFFRLFGHISIHSQSQKSFCKEDLLGHRKYQDLQTGKFLYKIAGQAE